LILIVGALSSLFGMLFLAISPLTRPPQRAELIRYGGGMAGVGAALLLTRLATGTIPDWLARRRSPSLRRRREESARRAARASAPSRSGGALILMLILVGLIAALLAQSHALARARAANETAARERAQLRQAAVEALREAAQRLADDEDLGADAASEPWAEPLDRETPLGIATRVRVRDEQSRFDLNNLSVAAGPGRRAAEDILMDLKMLCGDFSPASRVAALRDFIDADSAGSREADFYRRLDPPRRCADRVLYGWRELTAADGWSESIFARRPRERVGSAGFDAHLADHVTIIPAPRARPIPININTASRETLRAVMGLEQDRLVDMVLTLRAIRPIRQLDVFIVTAGPEAFDRLRPHLDVRSRYFRIHARAERNGRRFEAEALAVREDDGRVRIAQWLEDDLI
jgi:type II secretory pathway component PulK